tara:strand:+ start:243 stop:488 length:246 start_codon:yes stop_codon:yes gene_type:complete
MYNHLLNIEGLNNDELVEKIYDISDKIVKAQKSGYSNTAILDSMVSLQHQLREEYTTRVAQEKIKEDDNKPLDIGKIFDHE